MIKVEYERRGTALDATVTLPGNLTGNFIYNGRVTPLKAGVNHVRAE
jgi:hypothetical protein